MFSVSVGSGRCTGFFKYEHFWVSTPAGFKRILIFFPPNCKKKKKCYASINKKKLYLYNKLQSPISALWLDGYHTYSLGVNHIVLASQQRIMTSEKSLAHSGPSCQICAVDAKNKNRQQCNASPPFSPRTKITSTNIILSSHCDGWAAFQSGGESGRSVTGVAFFAKNNTKGGEKKKVSLHPSGEFLCRPLKASDFSCGELCVT